MKLSLAPLLVALASAVACGAPADEEPASDSSEIIGGVEASSASLDAVGAMLSKSWGGGWSPFCTATLVEPTLVITAKHCVVSRPGGTPRALTEEVYFGIGANAEQPKATYRVKDVITAPLNEGGFVKFGSDVALLVLEKPVEGVRPLKLFLGEIPAQRVGQRFTAIGFGVRDRDRTLGERRMGNLTLQAVRGKPMQKIFGNDRAKMDSFLVEYEGEQYPTTDEKRLDDFWDLELLAGHEAYLGMGEGDVQPCSGDSGGPLVGKHNGALTVFAVVSGSFKGRTYPCSLLGEMYATFGPETVTTLEAAGVGPCKGVPYDGVCEGTVAARCVSDREGPKVVTRTDCSDVNQVCASRDGRAQCMDVADVPPQPEEEEEDGGTSSGGSSSGSSGEPSSSGGSSGVSSSSGSSGESSSSSGGS